MSADDSIAGKLVEIFHIGPQKSGTTWLYRCLQEHPGCETAARDTVHYFDIFHHRTKDWYHDNFPDADHRLPWVDMTPSYIRSSCALRRIREYNPSAKIILSIRNPIERAFSHYWHEKKKSRYDYRFEECLTNYDLFQSWVEPGLYAEVIAASRDLFGSDRVLVQVFDDLETQPVLYFEEFCRFVEIDSVFRPSVVEDRINPARPKRSRRGRTYRAAAKRALSSVGLLGPARALAGRVRGRRSTTTRGRESIGDVDAGVLEQLHDIVLSDIERVERAIGRDLGAWKVPSLSRAS